MARLQFIEAAWLSVVWWRQRTQTWEIMDVQKQIGVILDTRILTTFTQALDSGSLLKIRPFHYRE